MSKSKSSKIIGVRLSNETIAKIEKALDSVNNSNTSISDYCKKVITRYAFRHEKRELDK